MKTTFLFGSGADTCVSNKLKSGEEFSKELIQGNYKKERGYLLGNDVSRYNLVYPTSVKVFIQTIASYEKDAEKIFLDDDYNDCIEYYNNGTDKVEFERIKKLCKAWYNDLFNNKLDGPKTEERDFFLKHAVFFDALDEKFNSLRYKEHNSNAKRVINAYYTIFILMMHSLYDLNDFEWSMENVCKKLNYNYDKIKIRKNYYDIVKNSHIDCSVVTTNYTELAEILTANKETLYLHGKLTWFEDLDNFTVYDCKNADEREKIINNRNCIPFIMIPSGVKPIICKKQIEQFYEFIQQLQNSDFLCIIGYRFNSEDDHINSIIGEWLRNNENKKMIYFNYKNEVRLEELKWIKDLQNEIASCDNEKDLVLNKRINNIVIKKGNSLKMFEKVINMIK